MTYITDKGISDKLIQPIRFFRATYGDMTDKHNYNYFEFAKKNISNQIVNVPINVLIKFQLQFPAYYLTLTECKIYCPDRTTAKFDIKTKVSLSSDLVLAHYMDSDGIIRTQFIYKPTTGFSSACPTGFGFIRVIATNGTTPITWESDLIHLFDPTVYLPSGNYETESQIIDNELGL